VISFEWIRHRTWEALADEREANADLANSSFDHFNPHLETRGTSEARAERAAALVHASLEASDRRRERALR